MDALRARRERELTGAQAALPTALRKVAELGGRLQKQEKERVYSEL